MKRKVLTPRTKPVPVKAPSPSTRTTRAAARAAVASSSGTPQAALFSPVDTSITEKTPRAKRRRRRANADPWLPKRKPKKNPNPRPKLPPPTHFTCRICAEELPVDDFIKWIARPRARGYFMRLEIPFECIRHLARNPRRKNDPVCRTCIGSSMAAQMETLGARKVGVGCLEPGCATHWGFDYIMKFFPDEKLETYNEGMMRVWIEDAKTAKCVKEGCDGIGLVDPLAAGYPQVSCPTCRTRMCASCKIEWHAGMTCADYAARNVHQKMTNTEKETLEIMQEKDGKRCPNCFIVIEKDGGCDSMYCMGCRTYFNWAMAASAVPGKGQPAMAVPSYMMGGAPITCEMDGLEATANAAAAAAGLAVAAAA